MHLRTKLLAGLGALLISGMAVLAQQPGVNSNLNTVWTLVYDASTIKPTYSAASGTILVTAPTDVCTLTGSATKTVKVRRVIVSGLATGVIAEPLLIQKRSTANTGGTAFGLTETPYDSQSAAATASATVYTTNPTTGTLVGTIADVLLTFANYTTGVGAQTTIMLGQLGSPVVLRGVAQQLVINLNAVTIPAGQLLCEWEWTEES